MKRVYSAAVSIALLTSVLIAACGPSDTTTTSSSVTSTSTTLPPGVMTFATCTDRFETLIRRESLPGTLPYSVRAAEDIDWLCGAIAQITITEAQGYDFANGDVVLLFFCDPADEDSSLAAQQAVAAAAAQQFAGSDDEIWAFIGDAFGYVVVSKEYRSQLGMFAGWARTAHQQLIDGK